MTKHNPLSASTHPALSANQTAWLADIFARNHARFGGFSMEATGDLGTGDDGGNENPGAAGGEQTYTKADVDTEVQKIAASIRADERRKAAEKYGDYAAIKTRADGIPALEDRIADLEAAGGASEARALRAEVALDKGLTVSQAKRLVGTTKEELEADADELLKDIGAQQHNHSPREGESPSNPGAGEMREFTRGLFARANGD